MDPPPSPASTWSIRSPLTMALTPRVASFFRVDKQPPRRDTKTLNLRIFQALHRHHSPASPWRPWPHTTPKMTSLPSLSHLWLQRYARFPGRNPPNFYVGSKINANLSSASRTLDDPGWDLSAIDALSATLTEYADIFILVLTGLWCMLSAPL